MKQVLFVCPYPTGQSPSQRFRFEQYFPLLRKHGFSFEIFSFFDLSEWNYLYKEGLYLRKIVTVVKGSLKRLEILLIASKYDFIFIHRESTPIGPPLIEWLLKKITTNKIIYDFDDAIWLINTSNENKIASPFKWHGKVGSICQWSYKISCGNSYLASYARQFNSNVIINPTTIDTETHHNPDLYPTTIDPNFMTVGWTGSHSTLLFLHPIIQVIESLWSKYPQVRLMIIADKDPGWNKPFIQFIQWNKETEIADLMKINIGIMPLPDNEWAKGKCGFKALQYLSLRKPALASPVGVNTKIIADGINGFLCNENKEWYEKIEYLIQNPEVLKEMGKNGREKIINEYSVISNAHNFLSLFEAGSV